MHFAGLPELIEAKFGIARVVGGNLMRERTGVPGKYQRARTEAAARQADVQGIEWLVAGVRETVLGADLELRPGLLEKADADFLPLDDIAGTKGGCAARARASGNKNQKGEK